MAHLYELSDIRDRIFEYWGAEKSATPVERRLKKELTDVCRVEAWSSACVVVGRLTEALFADAGASKSASLASRIDTILSRKDDQPFFGSGYVGGQSIRFLRNSSAHFDREADVTETEATLSIVSYQVVRGALMRTRPLEEVESHRIPRSDSRASREFIDSTDEDAAALLSRATLDDLSALIRASSLSQFRHVLRKQKAIGVNSDGISAAVIAELPYLLQIIGETSGTALYQVAQLLPTDRLRPLRFILFALSPWDSTWLTSKLRDGSSLHAVTRRLISMRRGKHIDWIGLGRDPAARRRDAELLWSSWNGEADSVHGPFDLAFAVPRPLFEEILSMAPDQAVFDMLARPVGYFRIGTVLAWYRRHGRSGHFGRKIVQITFDNLASADLSARCSFIVGTLTTGVFSQASLDGLSRLVRAARANQDDHLSLALTIYIHSARFGTRVAQEEFLYAVDSSKWSALVLLGVIATAVDLVPDADISTPVIPAKNFWDGPIEVPTAASELEIGLVEFALRTVRPDLDAELRGGGFSGERRTPSGDTPHFRRLVRLVGLASDDPRG